MRGFKNPRANGVWHMAKVLFFIEIVGSWAAWNQWSNCSVLCGEGVRTRERTCNSTLTVITCTIDGSNTTETRKCQQSKCTSSAPTAGTVNHSTCFLMTLFSRFNIYIHLQNLWFHVSSTSYWLQMGSVFCLVDVLKDLWRRIRYTWKSKRSWSS